MSKLNTHVAIFECPDDGVTILAPSPQCGLTFEQILEKDIPDDKPSVEVAREDLPESGVFFLDAWEIDYEEETVTVAMDRARLIAQDLIREERVGAFAKLDIEYQRATETDDRDRMAEVVAMKQVLRDLPDSPAVQEAQTPEELIHLARNSVKEAMA